MQSHEKRDLPGKPVAPKAGNLETGMGHMVLGAQRLRQPEHKDQRSRNSPEGQCQIPRTAQHILDWNGEARSRTKRHRIKAGHDGRRLRKIALHHTRQQHIADRDGSPCKRRPI